MDYKDELMHHGVLGMKWGISCRQKTRSTSSNELKRRGVNAKEHVAMAHAALKSKDSDHIKNSVRSRDSKNLKTVKRALSSKMEYWSHVGERAVAKNEELMSTNIDKISTKDYKQRAKELVD